MIYHEVPCSETDIEGVHYADSGEPGPVAVVLSRTHPDELDGVPITDELVENGVALTRGGLFVVKANLLAPDGEHYVHSNQNRRHLYPDQLEGEDWTKEDYERARGVELAWNVLAKSDASLDLHGHYEGAKDGREAVPSFLITEHNGLSIARDIGSRVTALGFMKVDVGGTDGFMNEWASRYPGEAKDGLWLEMGPNDEGSREQNVALGHASVWRFLISKQLVDADKKPEPLFSDEPTKYVEVDRAFPRLSSDDYVDSNLRTFDVLEEGQEIGAYRGEPIRAHEGQVIFFPDNDARTSEQTETGTPDTHFILGRNITEQVEASLR